MCFFIHLDYLRLAYLKKRIVDIAAPFHRGRRLLFLVFHLGAGERLGPGWFYSGNLNGLRVILPIFLQKARRLCWPQFSRIFQWKCWTSHSPSINTQKDNNTNRQTSIKTENWWHLKAVDQEERGQPFFLSAPALLDWKRRCFYYRMQTVDQIRDCSLCPPFCAF